MEKRNLTFEDKSRGIRRKGKGFVYKLIVSRASNSICDRLQGITLKTHKECILVRNKKANKFGNKGYEFIPYVFNHRFSGYVCQLKSNIEQPCEEQMSESQKKQILDLVENRLVSGYSYDEIYGFMQRTLKCEDKGMKTTIIFDIFI